VELTVVKVGGSFARSPLLTGIAKAVADGAGRVVVVPGGGPFADCVRREQTRVGYSDGAAHRMALLAMAEFAFALVDRDPRLVTAASASAIRSAVEKGTGPVWLPLNILAGRPDIPETWEMTSDSLAAWLAVKLKATRIIFLKRASPRSVALKDLVSAGVLDALSPHYLGRAGVPAWLCGTPHIKKLGAALASGGDIGRRIAV
jgi:dihydroneopterin aldolase